jgi:hypothetical protein
MHVCLCASGKYCFSSIRATFRRPLTLGKRVCTYLMNFVIFRAIIQRRPMRSALFVKKSDTGTQGIRVACCQPNQTFLGFLFEKLEWGCTCGPFTLHFGGLFKPSLAKKGRQTSRSSAFAFASTAAQHTLSMCTTVVILQCQSRN